MKLGVAISGCGIGAVTAYRIPALLAGIGLAPETFSCCSTSVLPMGLMGLGIPEQELTSEMEAWAEGLSTRRYKHLRRNLSLRSYNAKETPRILLCAADAIMAQPVVFDTSGKDMQPEFLSCGPSRFKEILPGMMGLTYGFKPQRWHGKLLCDFSVYFGNPFFSLKQCSAERILLIRFENSQCEPALVSVDRMARQKEPLADAVIRVPDLPYRKKGYIEAAEQVLQEAFYKQRQETLEKLIF